MGIAAKSGKMTRNVNHGNDSPIIKTHAISIATKAQSCRKRRV
jgi:hypothetical protein